MGNYLLARRLKGTRFLANLVALNLLALYLAVTLGSSGSMHWSDLLSLLNQDHSEISYRIITELRLPRALSAIAIGGMLGIAGALMQVLTRNPLADPYILGISGGAAVGALLAMLSGLATGLWLTSAAFGGALTSMLLVFVLARSRRGWSSTYLLLTGVIVATGWGALISIILSVAADQSLRGMIFWLMGDLSRATDPLPALLVLVAALIVITPHSRALNMLARGELQAAVLGVETNKLRIVVYCLASLLAAVSVTLAGSIGFVGLIVPHIVRLRQGNDHRYLIPAAALCGGFLLLIADTASRVVLAPRQLPVGAVTAFFGVPFFLYLLRRIIRQ